MKLDSTSDASIGLLLNVAACLARLVKNLAHPVENYFTRASLVHNLEACFKIVNMQSVGYYSV